MTEHLCPLWGEPLLTPPRTAEGVYLVYSPRAGGVYMGCRADRQKASLSHWIYRQHLAAGLGTAPCGHP